MNKRLINAKVAVCFLGFLFLVAGLANAADPTFYSDGSIVTYVGNDVLRNDGTVSAMVYFLIPDDEGQLKEMVFWEFSYSGFSSDDPSVAAEYAKLTFVDSGGEVSAQHEVWEAGLDWGPRINENIKGDEERISKLFVELSEINLSEVKDETTGAMTGILSLPPEQQFDIVLIMLGAQEGNLISHNFHVGRYVLASEQLDDSLTSLLQQLGFLPKN